MPLTYQIPQQYFFRLHQVKPRFKFNPENVLVFMTASLSKIPRTQAKEFNKKANEAIRMYPGNQIKTEKTISNWRTEISSLFGLIEYDSKSRECWASAMSYLLSNNQDLIEFLRYFLFYFQYPGGYLKPHETLDYIKAKINFKPARYILNVLNLAETKTRKRYGITKAEATHCIFNDLRVSRDGRSVKNSFQQINTNRKKGLVYDQGGDVIRYAGDILDYMVMANLLVLHGDKYFLNHNEDEIIKVFRKSNIYFNLYDPLYTKSYVTLEDVKSLQDGWFTYINKIAPGIFKTDILNYYLTIKETKIGTIPEAAEEFIRRIENNQVNKKEIGDFGESLIHGHECMRIKIGGKDHLIHLIKNMPTPLSVGYDILSLELDESKRYIEVKTTISNSEIKFTQFHLTTNEWIVAEGLDKRYFVYRLMINKHGTKLFIIQNPVSKYKSDKIRMVPRDGADISFNERAGEWTELLTWAN